MTHMTQRQADSDDPLESDNKSGSDGPLDSADTPTANEIKNLIEAGKPTD